ncbi:hypothetical protein C7M84_018701 [Penaeus vannamei]|uniref:Gustatory receptor n=1 Tax=Penaeus vannamei TaxID=6689 RepID=A0A423SGX5_PENVA|nr:hypothetical protein C7M84_018701 [Penaeus vannamei]
MNRIVRSERSSAADDGLPVSPPYIRRVWWLLSVVRIVGCWPYREVRTAEETNEHSFSSRRKDDLARQELSWLSYPPYWTLLLVLQFVVLDLYYIYNTGRIVAAGNFTASEALVSVPWLGGTVLPCVSAGLSIMKAGEITIFLDHWLSVEKRFSHLSSHTPRASLPYLVVSFYFSLGFASVAFIGFLHWHMPESSIFIGNLLPSPWSHFGHVLQYVSLFLAWTGSIVPEALLCLLSHAFASFYRGLCVKAREIFDKWELHKKQQTQYGRSTVHAYENHGIRDSIQHLWDLYEDVETLVDEMNTLFSPMILLVYSVFMIMTCSLIIPFLKSGDVRDSAYLTIAFSYVVRLPFLVITEASLQEQHASFRYELCRGHARMSLSGAHLPYLDALLARLAAKGDVGVSAWGFFTVRRDTLLTIVSLLVSYIVIMLQA